jgi:hypothetical protein
VRFLIVVVVLGVAAVLMLAALAQAFVRAPSINCLSNLKVIHLAARVWAQDHETNTLPTDFILFTNQLTLPKLLKCQADHQHAGILAWSDLPSSTISYVIFPTGAFKDSKNEYVRCTHHQYAVMGDGRASHVYRWGKIVPTKP